ncbi:MAG: diversity-generating retroelement protein Avd [Caldilinea sp.]|nr:diversity-generating retroelement protein Avd [Caldilinea sp.]
MTLPSIEFPIFARYSDLMAWLVQRVESFPRAKRFTLGNRLLDSGFRCHQHLVRARKLNGAARATALLDADVELETLRLQLRLAHELHCLSTRQYEHGAGLVNEIGRLLGSWRN